jgi:hypothetical protein
MKNLNILLVILIIVLIVFLFYLFRKSTIEHFAAKKAAAKKEALIKITTKNAIAKKVAAIKMTTKNAIAKKAAAKKEPVKKNSGIIPQNNINCDRYGVPCPDKKSIKCNVDGCKPGCVPLNVYTGEVSGLGNEYCISN